MSVNLNEAMRALGDRSRHLIDGLKEVEKLHINTTLSNLPKYIVVGDQSAGKSSIVRALCGVALPRSIGTTTRCVYRITTSKATSGNKPWTCNISLVQEYELKGRSQWTACSEPKVTQFCTLYDEAELEIMLRRAQLALLNPNVHVEHYVKAAITETADNKAIFSPNIISLEIRAPSLTELIFYDLPGCINSYDMPKAAKNDTKQRQKDEKDLIEMIRKTVVRYIRDDSCSIVLACSADQDLEMSLTMRHVRDNDAEDRCIGVLTKADLVPRAKLPAILEILQGKKYPLGHSWYITRQLSQQEIEDGADHEAARDREIAFFATSPWADHRSLYDQYGITTLAGKISNNLALHILLELPNMMLGANSLIENVEAQLAQFPEPPKEPKQVVTSLIRQVVECLARHIKAASNENHFRHGFDRRLADFSKQLRASKLDVYMDRVPITVVNLDPGAQDNEAKSSQTDHAPTSGAGHQKKRKGGPSPGRPSKRKPSRTLPEVEVYNLEDLKEAYEIGATNSIPGSINDQVTEQLIRESCIKWDGLLTDLLEDVSSLVIGIIGDSVDEAVGEWTQSQVYRETKDALLDYFNTTMVSESGSISQQLSRMREFPGTFSSEYVAMKMSHREAFAQQRYARPQYAKKISADPLSASRPLEDLVKEARELDSKWVNERLANDEYGTIIDCVATVYTIHDIMSSKFADSVCVDLKAGVLAKLRNGTAAMLEGALKVFDTEHCVDLLAQDPIREKERERLVGKKNKLQQALRLLKNMRDTESQFY